jgi:calmodulin
MKELGLNPSDAELQDLVNEADVNKDGVICFDGLAPLSSRR